MKRFRRSGGEEGFALTAVLVIALVLAIGSAAFLGLTNSDVFLTRREAEGTRAFYVAQAGTEKAVAHLKVLLSKGQGYSAADLASITAPSYDGYTFDEFAVAPEGTPHLGTLENGTYRGLRAYIQNVRITSAVSSQGFAEVSVRISEEVEAQFIPLFQFAIFYNDDLEILPGPAMTVTGPVHSNSDIYMGTDTSLSFDSIVTCVGDIFHRRKDGSPVSSGPVQVRDGEGVYRGMRNPDGTWLDCTQPNWTVEAANRWDGNVASASHQVSPLRLPVVGEGDARQLIERGAPDDSPQLKAAKYYYKADLRIIDGKTYDKSGALVDLNYPDPADPTKTLNPISTKTFYNYREGTTVSVTEIDVGKLRASGKSPANGILYVSDSRGGYSRQDAVRLVNGEELPAGGLTVATDRPAYIWGDYNTVNKKPASVMCDAINILSNAWKDASSQSELTSRVASNTAVNAAIVAGNTVTTEGQYNGGVENMPRFLENWSDKTLTYRGSLVELWASEVATGNWVYGAPYYTAPNRNWGYDTDLSDPTKSPPGAPNVYTVEVAHWQYE